MIINKKSLILDNSKEVKFEYEIRQVIEADMIIVVLLEIPINDHTVDNIYGINKDGIKQWRVESHNDKFKEFPYEQMIMKDGKILATDFYGRRYHIRITDGKIIEKDIVK